MWTRKMIFYFIFDETGISNLIIRFVFQKNQRKIKTEELVDF